MPSIDRQTGGALAGARSLPLSGGPIDTQFMGGARTFFNKGANGRWKHVLSPAEIAGCDDVTARNLTPEGAPSWGPASWWAGGCGGSLPMSASHPQQKLGWSDSGPIVRPPLNVGLSAGRKRGRSTLSG